MSQGNRPTNESIYTCMDDDGATDEPRARIQKISQEGSKSTYVIIVNKDCLKSESGQRSLAGIKQAPVSNIGRHVPRRKFVQGSEIRKNLTDISDRDFDSPTLDTASNLNLKSSTNLSQEDVRLNLTDMNYDEYDSGLSASSVFLKSEKNSMTYDSAIETDMSQNSTNLDGSQSKNKIMNMYVNQSCIPKQNDESQHVFPVISPQFVDAKGAASKLAYNTPVLSDKTASHPTARKIVLVPDACNTTETSQGSRKKISYSSQAVPVANQTLGTPVNIGYLRQLNPNAVPVFNDISPIQGAGDSRSPPFSSANILPPQPPNVLPYTSDNKGPLTSTPVLSTNPRLAHLKQESSTHRPVYIIQSPFNRRKSDSNSSLLPTNVDLSSEVSRSNSCDTPGLRNLNNSSGFVSASDSLEQSDNTPPIQITNVRSLTDCKPDTGTTFVKLEKNVIASNENLSPAVSSEISEPGHSGGEVIRLEDGESDTGVGTESEMEPSVSSSQESELADDKGESLHVFKPFIPNFNSL